eukprot:EG_transcript_13527
MKEQQNSAKSFMAILKASKFTPTSKKLDSFDSIEPPSPSSVKDALEKDNLRTMRVVSDSVCHTKLYGFKVSEVNASSKVNQFKRRSLGQLMTFPTTPPFQLKATHVQSILDHHEREKDLLSLMRIALQRDRRPFMVDAGANHGTYSLYAAMLGAEVAAIEPQRVLVGNIIESLERNGLEDKVRLYHNAILDVHTGVHLSEGDNGADGGVASVVPGGSICTLTLDDVIQQRPVAFLKIDVEGNDLKVMQSATQALKAGLVRNVLVEFGPPQRWFTVAQQMEDDGVQAFVRMQRFGFVALLAPSQCTGDAVEELRLRTLTLHGVRVACVEAQHYRPLVRLMRTTTHECYLLW